MGLAMEVGAGTKYVFFYKVVDTRSPASTSNALASIPLITIPYSLSKITMSLLPLSYPTFHPMKR
ncbi:hypothetical protein CsatA_009250 [Cannabis sativa]